MMPQRPKFSILLPTKNRSHLVGNAVRSVLNQTWKDFELIVSDNDDDPLSTKNVIAGFNDPRIRYFRTSGNLSMPDNWEFALDQAKGKWITVLQDKQALYPTTLECLNKVLEKNPAIAITWPVDGYENRVKKPILKKYNGSGKVLKSSSDEIISKFMTNDPRAWNLLPRMINSCVDRELIDFVRDHTPLKRFFVDVTPDLSASFIILRYTDWILYLDMSLSVWSAMTSNATNIRKKGKGHNRFFKDGSGENKAYNRVPIKNKYIIKNIVLNDYLNLSEIIGGRLVRYNMTPRNYFIACYSDIIKSLSFGANVLNELLLLRRYFNSLQEKDKKGLWKTAITVPARVFSQRLMLLLPKIGKRVYRKASRHTCMFTGYISILAIVSEKKFHPKYLN